MAISGGISWVEVVTPLIQAHWSNGLLFCLYVFFTEFTLLNVINGIFVETAIERASVDKDEVIQEQLMAEESAVQQLINIFFEADADESGSVTLEELHSHFKDNQVRAYMKGLGIEMSEASSIFKLLDLDSSGLLDIEEFVYGLLRIKGGARAIDTVTLMYENQRMMTLWHEFFEYAEGTYEHMLAWQRRTDRCLTVVVEAVLGKEATSLVTTPTGNAPDPSQAMHHLRVGSGKRRGTRKLTKPVTST